MKFEDRTILTEKETAEYLGISQRGLQKMRYEGRSPRFSRLGNVIRYRKEHVDAWFNAKSENPQQAA